MSQIILAAEKRLSAGKGVSRRLRVEGRIPGVLYGRDSSATLFSVDEKTMASLMKEHGLNTILHIELDGKKHTCMIAEYQKDVFQRFLLHVDLKLVDLSSKVIVKVPVNLTGQQVVRSKGGIAQLYLRELKVRVLATDIPKSIDLDVSDLLPGQSRKLSSVKVGDNLELMDPLTTTVVNILAPRALAAARNQAADK